MNYHLFLCVVLMHVTVLADVIIDEVHYNPAVKTEHVEFIELYNSGAAAVQLGGWRISGAVEFVFPENTAIAANGYTVVAQNPAELKTKFGADALGPWIGLLSNQGEPIVLRDAVGTEVDKVDYKLGFPWPTVGDAPGFSIELINPSFDNELGGNWRRSVNGAVSNPTATLIEANGSWKYWKGTAEPSDPLTLWRSSAFDDSNWSAGAAPIGYDAALAMGTALSDMRGSYTSVYFRRKFNVDDPSAVQGLTIEALYDDGIQVWINGQRVINSGLPNRDVAHDEVATGPTRESDAYDAFVISSPSTVLRAGENVMAVQLHNISVSSSSDAFMDLKMTAQLGSATAGPTPGNRNSVFATNSPPVIRRVDHLPEQPKSGEPVTITAKITDLDGVASVALQYQIVDPGAYIELNDPVYQTNWQSVVMTDDGKAGDATAGDSIYTVVLSESLQAHRRLVRYRIVAADRTGLSVRVPYEDDPEPNFAYFVYDGVPALSAAISAASTDPAKSQVQNFSAAEMGRLPTYHLLAKRSSVENATWLTKYGGDLYPWWGTLVYDGKVYDHIRYRARGGVWRYAMGKNMWKFDLNRGHEFQARDNFGRKYKTTWKKVNLGANIQQGNFNHRGEQGMFESVGFALFNLAGVEAPKTHWINFRIIDDAAEAPANNQYGGDYWGLYLAIEQEDGRFLDEHDLPDGNLYKMEGGTGELNNQGLEGATDKSDLNTFQNTYRSGGASAEWWRQNFDLDQYYSYHTVVHGIHHYDICDGKNYFFYLNPETQKWSVHTWDLDLTWANNMYRDCDGADPFHPFVESGGLFNLEFKNRIREVRDLLYNTDQTWKLIEEYAAIVKGTNSGPNVLAADRAMWDYNPVMVNSSITQGEKAGQGRFYQFPLESAKNLARKGSFEAGVAIMKDYVVERAAFLDRKATDDQIPTRPTVTYTGPAGFPLNGIELLSSAYSGAGAFAAMKWRVGEIRDAAPGVPGIYEIEPVWESAELTSFLATAVIPSDVLKVGHQYRARVRMKDVTGRWSNWSLPLEFTAGEPDTSAGLLKSLRLTEIMYNPPAGSDSEYLEVKNVSATETLQLAGATFTEGIEFTFPAGAKLAPGEYGLIVKADPTNSFGDFRTFYHLSPAAALFGPYAGSLDNSGEKLTLKTATAGAVLFSVSYDDAGEWPANADGGGYSLVIRDENSTGVDDPAKWRASNALNGSPGRADSAGLTVEVAMSRSGISLQFQAVATVTYRVEFSDRLGGGWQTLRTVAGTSGEVVLDEQVLPLSERYYRIVANP